MIDKDLDKAAEAIFAQALERQTQEDRARYLQEACGGNAELLRWVEALLAAHGRASSFLQQPPSELMVDDTGGTDAAPLSSSEKPGDVIGPYTLLELIAEGGMGAVFLAEQARPVRRRVALKIIKPGLDTRQVIARFEAERQALAMMDHPHIARVLDAGATAAGRPYFAMELVRGGVPITRYCDEHHLAPRQRLELFVSVCQAVQHAHTKGIIHRDLKPTNVLVSVGDDGRPVPKVIDFGIAKATAGGERLTDLTLLTEFRQLVGTPLYMSPEQAEAGQLHDVDTRSDVYSLGVLLYELLTGTTPFTKEQLAKAAYEEVRRIIREEDPPRPSTRLSTLGETLGSVSAQRQTDPKRLSQLVRGELDWIVMKALEKDRSRRYETAVGLAHDVERYLSDRPVEACPPSRAYRLRKFARRNKAVLATAALFAIVLSSAAVVSSWQAVRAKRAETTAISERSRADAEAAEARAVNDFVTTMLAAADPDKQLGDKVTVLQATHQAIKRLDEGALKDQPLVEAAVRYTIGRTLRELGRLDDAEPQLRRSLELHRHHRAAKHQSIGHGLTAVAQVLRLRGKHADAEPLLREALEISRRADPPSEADVARDLNNLALLLQELGRRGEAETMHREVLSIMRRAQPQSMAPYLNNFGLLLLNQGKLPEAEAAFREAVSLSGHGHPNTAIALFNLSATLRDQGKLAEAEPFSLQALEIHRKSFPPDHHRVATAVNGHARLLHEQGKHAEAEPLYREALDVRTRSMGRDRAGGELYNLARLLLDRGNVAEAEQLAVELIEINDRVLPPGDRRRVDGLELMAGVLRARDRSADAESLLRETLAIVRLQQPHPLDVARTATQLGLTLRDLRKYDESKQLFSEVLGIYRGTFPGDHPFTATALHNLGLVLFDIGEVADAEAAFRESIQMRRRVLPPAHPARARGLNQLARLLIAQRRFADAQTLLVESLEIARKALPAGHVDRIDGLGLLADAQVGLGRYADAESHLLEAIAEVEAHRGSAERDRMYRETADRLVRLYEAWQKPEEAAKWRADAPATRPATRHATAPSDQS